MKLVLVTPPAEMPVSRAEAKLFIRIDGSDEDTQVDQLIAAATAWAEEQARRAFVTRTLKGYLDEFPECGQPIRMPWPRLQSVASLKYYDAAGVQQTLDPSLYQVDAIEEPGLIVPAVGKSWPAIQCGRVNAIEIQFTAGYGAATAVDPRAKQAILCLASHWYTNREAVLTGTISKELEFALCSLLGQLWHGRLP